MVLGAAARRAPPGQRRGTVVRTPRPGRAAGRSRSASGPGRVRLRLDYYELVHRPEYELPWFAPWSNGEPHRLPRAPRPTPARPVAGRRFYDEAKPARSRPSNSAPTATRPTSFADRSAARPRGRGGSDNRDDAAGDRTGRLGPPRRAAALPPGPPRALRAWRRAPPLSRTGPRSTTAASTCCLACAPFWRALNAGRTLEKIFLLRGTKNSLVSRHFGPGAHGRHPRAAGARRRSSTASPAKTTRAPWPSCRPSTTPARRHRVQRLFEEGKVPFLLLLDRITDVRNFGAIARTAECLGVQAIVVPGRGAAQINGDALETSAGAAEYPCRFAARTTCRKPSDSCSSRA
ncbi:MAG: TrmH family RNA methyltransferase [Hymenobacter sp.]